MRVILLSLMMAGFSSNASLFVDGDYVPVLERSRPGVVGECRATFDSNAKKIWIDNYGRKSARVLSDNETNGIKKLIDTAESGSLERVPEQTFLYRAEKVLGPRLSALVPLVTSRHRQFYAQRSVAAQQLMDWIDSLCEGPN